MSSRVTRLASITTTVRSACICILACAIPMGGCSSPVRLAESSWITVRSTGGLASGPIPAWEGDWEIRAIAQYLHHRDSRFREFDGPGVVHFASAIGDTSQLERALRQQGWRLFSDHLAPDDAVDVTDSPDVLGRVQLGVDREPRRFAVVEIRFASASLSAAGSGVGDVGAVLSQWAFVSALGVATKFDTAASRHIASAVASSQSNLVTTTQQSVSAGTSIDVTVGEVSGGRYRVRGTFQTSQFVGTGIDTAETSTPLDLDLPSGCWQTVAVESGANVGLTFPALGSSAALSAVLFQVRVTP